MTYRRRRNGLWLPSLRGAPALGKIPLGIIAAGGGGAPALYDPVPIKFDGSATYLSRGAGLTGASNANTGVCSFWFRHNKAYNDKVRFVLDASPESIQIGSDHPTNFMGIGVFDATTSRSMAISEGVIGYRESSRWHHFLSSWDAGSDTMQCYLDDVAVSNSVTVDTGAQVDYTASDWFIGASESLNDHWRGELSDFWLFFGGSFLDLTTTGNRRKFIDANKRPVSLGADGSTPMGSAPIVYLNNPLATWQNNLGTGGDFTEHGTLLAGDDFGPGPVPLLIREEVFNVPQGNSPFTISGIDFGPAYATRRCIFVFTTINDYEAGPYSATIGGVACSGGTGGLVRITGSGANSGSFDGQIVMIWADVSSNQWLDVVLTNMTTSGNGSIFCVAYSVDSSLLDDAAPTSNSNNVTGATSNTVTLNTGSGGFVIAALTADFFASPQASGISVTASTDPMVLDEYMANTATYAGKFYSRRRETSAATPFSVTFSWTNSSQAIAALFHWK